MPIIVVSLAIVLMLVFALFAWLLTGGVIMQLIGALLLLWIILWVIQDLKGSPSESVSPRTIAGRAAQSANPFRQNNKRFSVHHTTQEDLHKYRTIDPSRKDTVHKGWYEVWFILSAKECVAVFSAWLRENCPKRYGWFWVPGSALRKVEFQNKEDAEKFIEFINGYDEISSATMVEEENRYKPIAVSSERNIRDKYEVWFTPVREREGFYHTWLSANYPRKYSWYFFTTTWHLKCEFQDKQDAEAFVTFFKSRELGEV